MPLSVDVNEAVTARRLSPAVGSATMQRSLGDDNEFQHSLQLVARSRSTARSTTEWCCVGHDSVVMMYARSSSALYKSCRQQSEVDVAHFRPDIEPHHILLSVNQDRPSQRRTTSWARCESSLPRHSSDLALAPFEDINFSTRRRVVTDR